MVRNFLFTAEISLFLGLFQEEDELNHSFVVIIWRRNLQHSQDELNEYREIQPLIESFLNEIIQDFQKIVLSTNTVDDSEISILPAQSKRLRGRTVNVLDEKTQEIFKAKLYGYADYLLI